MTILWDELRPDIDALREWQRHHLLREFGNDGQVKAENLKLSGSLDRCLDALETAASITRSVEGQKH